LEKSSRLWSSSPEVKLNHYTKDLIRAYTSATKVIYWLVGLWCFGLAQHVLRHECCNPWNRICQNLVLGACLHCLMPYSNVCVRAVIILHLDAGKNLI